MNNKKLKIASRNSPLALVQTNIIKDHLLNLYPDLKIEIIAMTTEGDRRLTMPLATVGGKGLFVKELETALLEKRADIAVHSSKDMPVNLPDGLTIAVFFKRDDPRDAFLSNQYQSLYDLPANAIVGTSSLRRQCLLKHLRPDLDLQILRGNVQTRLKKLDAGEFAAIVLAAAGLERLGITARAKDFFDPEIFTPAATQGIMCIECRSTDIETLELLKPLHHNASAICATAERSMNLQLQGGCQVPIGAYATLANNQLQLRGLVGSPDGTNILRATATSTAEYAKQLGIDVAEKLRLAGADAILQKVYQNHG